MSALGERKKRLHIFIPESLEEDVRDYVATTYHRYERGQISSVFIQAVRYYLDPKTHDTHTYFKIDKIQQLQIRRFNGAD